jgi:hypothetical protein
VIQFGDSALKFAELRQVARGGTVLVELLGQVPATIHVGNGRMSGPLRDAGGKLFDGHAQAWTSRSEAVACLTSSIAC